jgi:hypothetical protein
MDFSVVVVSVVSNYKYYTYDKNDNAARGREANFLWWGGDPLFGTEKPDKSKIPERQRGGSQENGVKRGVL